METSTAANLWMLEKIMITALLLSLIMGGCYDNGYNPDKEPFYLGKTTNTQKLNEQS